MTSMSHRNDVGTQRATVNHFIAERSSRLLLTIDTKAL